MRAANSGTNMIIKHGSKITKAIPRIDNKMEFVQYLPTIKLYNPDFYGGQLTADIYLINLKYMSAVS
jgi:hypothetical protein